MSGVMDETVMDAEQSEAVPPVAGDGDGQLLDGTVTRVNEFGLVVEEATFDRGVLHGSFRQYDEEGRLLHDVEYRGGVLHGMAFSYDASGRVTAETLYSRGLRNGLSTIFNRGRPVVCAGYKAGILDGFGQR